MRDESRVDVKYLRTRWGDFFIMIWAASEPDDVGTVTVRVRIMEKETGEHIDYSERYNPREIQKRVIAYDENGEPYETDDVEVYSLKFKSVADVMRYYEARLDGKAYIIWDRIEKRKNEAKLKQKRLDELSIDNDVLRDRIKFCINNLMDTKKNEIEEEIFSIIFCEINDYFEGR